MLLFHHVNFLCRFTFYPSGKKNSFSVDEINTFSQRLMTHLDADLLLFCTYYHH